MAKTTNVNFKLDSSIKERMEDACAAMGLTMSAAFTLLATKVANERHIPFEICADPFYSSSNLNHLPARLTLLIREREFNMNL